MAKPGRPKSPQWPFEESPTAKLKHIIEFYRDLAMESDRLGCELLDMKMADWGQTWVAGNGKPDDLDRFMTAPQIADERGIAQHTVRAWARNHPEKIPTIRHGNRVVFRLRDVLNFQVAQSPANIVK